MMIKSPCGEVKLPSAGCGKGSLSLRKAIHRLWKVFLMIGFAYQVTAITIIYFNYEVNTAISIESSTGSPLGSSIEFPDLTVCFDTESLIEPSVVSTGSIDPFINPLANLSVEQMLRHTPDPGYLIDTCISRISPSDLAASDARSSGRSFNSLHRVQLYSKASCSKLFNVTKGIFEEYTCYTITFNDDGHLKFNMRPIVYSGKWSRLLYLFHLNESSFDTFSLIKPLIHPAKTIPYTTSAYSSWLVRKSHDQAHVGRNMALHESSSQPSYNSFKSAYKLYKIYRLSPPYESKCVNYTRLGFHGQEDCIQQCLLDQLTRKLHLVPFTCFIRAPINLPQLTLSQLESPNVSQLLQSSDDHCLSQCHYPSCFSQISITSAESELYPNLRLILFSPSSPQVIVSEEVAFRLLDYLIYLFSCFGSWFGLCWFTLNPVKVYDQVKSLHPKLHTRCLSPSMKKDKSSRGVEKMKEEKNCHSFSRYSKFNSNYNSMLGFVSREMDAIKSLTQGSIRRAREELHREICEIKSDLKTTKKALAQVKQILLGHSKGTISRITASFADESLEP